MPDLTEIDIPLAVAAAVAALAWICTVLATAVLTRPGIVRPAPRTMDLGPEPPAIADFLANGLEVDGNAVAATVLDLAARKLLSLEQTGPDPRDTLIRVTDSATGAASGLLTYERRVLHRITTLASDGVLPARALAQGTPEQNEKWRQAFDREVVADARSRGLSQRRYPVRLKALLILLALVPALLAAFAARNSDANWVCAGAVFAVVLLVAFLRIKALRGDRQTNAGRAACAQWLGVRDWIAADEQFRRLPPAAAAIWDRYLGYGAGFGITRTAITALPFGARDERRAWSTFGGRWHEVRLGYIAPAPRRIRHPKQSVQMALRRIAACLVLVPGMVWIAAHQVWRVDLPLRHGSDGRVFTALAIAAVEMVVSVRLYNLDSSRTATNGRIALRLLVPGILLWVFTHKATVNTVISQRLIDDALLAVSVFLALQVTRYLVLLLGAVMDLVIRRRIVGEVVRIRDRPDARHIAVDPGGLARVRAWPVKTNAFPNLHEGATVSVERGRGFGYVHSVGVTSSSGRVSLFTETA